MTTRADLPVGTVTFLFTDIEGSTRLLRDLGTERYGEILTEHNRLLREALAAAGGTEVDRQGDSFFVVFRTAGAAVRGAVAAQRAIAAADWPGSRAVRVRMGIHTGEASLGSDGYVGFAVHQAARIGDAGHGGQVLLSGTTASLVEHELPDEVGLRDLGENRLPDLERPQRLFQLVVDGLQSDFPPLATREPVGGTTVLLERERELASIERALEAARAGAGRLVAIEGPAGMGKTRLVAEARTFAAKRGMAVLSARGGELEHEFSYGVVRQLFEPALASFSTSERGALFAGAAALAAPLFDEASLTEAIAGAGDVTTNFPTLHGLFWLLSNLALRRPVLLAVDDLHWSDSSSIRWISYLSRRLEDLPVLVVVGSRPPEQSEDQDLVEAILHDPAVTVLRPAGLSEAAVTVLIQDRFSGEPHPEFVSACYEATGGNPLLLRALLDAAAGEGLGTRTAEDAARVREIGPEAVVRAVSLRLSRLPSEAVLLARAVSVLGDGIAIEAAAQLAGLEREAARHAATTLGRQGLLRIERDLSFTHPVLRGAVYSDLSASEREVAHTHAARLLVDSDAPAEKVAAHLMLIPGSADEVAVRVLRDAADRSLAQGDPQGACAYLSRALEEPPPEAERGEVLYRLGHAKRLIDSPGSVEHFQAAYALAEDPRLRGEIALELGRSLFYSSRVQEAVQLFERSIAEVRDLDTELLRRLEAGLLSVTTIFPTLTPLAQMQFERIATIPLDDDLGSRMLLAMQAFQDMRTMAATLEDCVARCERALDGPSMFAEDTPAFAFATVALTAADRWETASGVYDRAFADARVRGSISAYAVASIFRGYLEIFTGDLAEAIEDLRNAIVASDQHGLQTGIPYAVAFLADAQMQMGDLDGAARTLQRLEEAGELARTQWFFFDSRGRLKHLQGRYRDALGDYNVCGRLYEGLGGVNPALISWRSQAALAHLALGDRDTGRKLAEEELALARRWGAPRSVAKALRVAGMVEGGQQGVALLTEAVELLAGSRASLERARGELELGAALLRQDRVTEARQHLQVAGELAHAGGARLLAERAEAELQAAGTRLSRPAVTAAGHLTATERRIAAMAAKAMTARDIAQALFVTPKAVESDLASVFQKLGVSSRAELAHALESVDEAAGDVALSQPSG